MATTVRIENLKKSYGAVEAVKSVSFSIATGEIFGLLGPNGAGKTTTVECLLGLREADSGTIDVCGLDARREPASVKRKTGAQLQSTALQDKITPREAVLLFSALYGVRPDPDALLAKFQLTEKAHARYEGMSGGQRQRLALALALVNDPEFLVLDEPTASLDPQSRRELHDVIRAMRAGGKTILLTTHYIEEAEQLCDRIAVIDHGTIVAHGTPAELIARASTPPRILAQTARPLDAAALNALQGVESAELREGNRCELKTRAPGAAVLALARELEAQRNELLDIQIVRPTLEDVFLELTGRRLRD